MNRNSLETIGVRYTAWAALNRDPLEDRVEFTCPHCGENIDVFSTGGGQRTGHGAGLSAPAGLSVPEGRRAARMQQI